MVSSIDQYAANWFHTFTLGMNFGKTFDDTKILMFRLPLNNTKSGPHHLSMSFAGNRCDSPKYVETGVMDDNGELITNNALGYGDQINSVENNPHAVRAEVERLNNILVDPVYLVMSNNQHDLVEMMTEYFPDEMTSFKKINLNDANFSSHLKRNYNKRYNRNKYKYALSLAVKYLKKKWPEP